MWRTLRKLQAQLQQPTDILPLIIFRIAFGILMCASSIRFVANGWVHPIYIQPEFHFTYLGFEWVQPLDGLWMYSVFLLLIILCLFIMVGFAYRLSIILFFLVFTYVELIDKATYLNHYYFISLMSFLLIFLPLNRYFSVDVLLRPHLKTRTVPMWMIVVIRLQLGIVYFFAGFAKLNADWLLEGLPMKIWLRAHTDFPIIGSLFDYGWVAILMSWMGAIYDLTIPLWLLWQKTRFLAYGTVIIFHLMTAFLFPIGMFPFVMIASTLIFFTGDDFRHVPRWLTKRFGAVERPETTSTKPIASSRLLTVILILFFVVQLFLPLRHYLYQGDTNWTMEGYRFAWRVLLNEKKGFATFYIVDETTGRRQIVYGNDYLTEQQVRHMSYQPDMILEFAHYLGTQHSFDPTHKIAVYAEVYVVHNGHPSTLLIDPTQNLLDIERDIFADDWIIKTS